MIILDSNVVSEPTKLQSSDRVLKWLDEQARQTLYFTTVNLAEILAGLAVLPAGKRRLKLEVAMTGLINTLFAERILDFDIASANAYANIFAEAKKTGRPTQLIDMQVASIAKANRCAVATRDTAPFIAAGIEVINPWEMR